MLRSRLELFGLTWELIYRMWLTKHSIYYCICYILDFYLFCLNLMANSNFTQKSYPESDNISSLPLFIAAWHPIRTEVEFPSRCCSECFYSSEEKPESSWWPSGPMLPSWCCGKLTILDCHQLSCCSPVKGPPQGSQLKSFHCCPLSTWSALPQAYLPRIGLPHSSGLLTIHVSFPGCMLCAC